MNEKYNFFVEIDTVASNTWPAESTSYIDNWLLRASQGVSKRANSVLAIGEYPNGSDWLAKTEQFYKELGLPSIFHVSSASPKDLDEQLNANGYAIDTPCLMMTATSQEVADQALTRMLMHKNESIEIEWSHVADADWLDAFITLEKFPEERRAVYIGLFERMPVTKGFVKLKQDGQIIALGTAIVENEWAGFVNVIVREDQRGKGLSYALMHALTAWSTELGATKQYLQVIATNKPAVTLYENLGYHTHYGYHYRIKYDL